MRPVKIVNIKFAVSKIKYIGNNKICVVDENNTVRIYELNEFKLVDGFKIKLPKNNPLEDTVDISKNGKYLAIAMRNKKKTTVWSIKEKKLLYTLGWHKGDVLSVKFDEEERYLLTGGEDGRSYVWSMATGKMITTLPPHADYITTVAFSKNTLWASTGSFDKVITITNISSMEISYRRKYHQGAVKVLKFLTRQRMVSADKSGEIVMWNYARGKIEEKFPPLVDEVLDLAFNEDESFMFAIAFKNKNIFLYSVDDYELVSDNFLRVLNMPSVLEYVPSKHYLIVGTFEGEIYFFDMYKHVKELIEKTEANDFVSAYALVEQNPFLKKTPFYKDLEEKWNKILLVAQKKFERGETEIAKRILKPFLMIPSKRSLVQSVYNDFSEFEKFKKAVTSVKFPLAYSLVTKYPYLKNTLYYKKMEDAWKHAFQKAKELIFQPGKEDEVREILKPFRGVTEKTPFIQSLFNEKQLFQILSQKLKKKEFNEFFALINRFPFLSDTDEYDSAIKYAKALEKQADELFKKGEYKKVLNIAEILDDFPMYQEKTDELKEKARALLEFQRILASKDLNKIEKYIKEYPFLEDIDDYKKVDQEWKDAFLEAEMYAAEGNVERILEKLKDYMKVDEKRIKIGQLVKSAYLQQIITLLGKALKGEKVSDQFNKAVKNYIKIFGSDMEINDLIEKAQKLKIKVKGDFEEGDINKWYQFKLPAKIWGELKSK